MTSSEPYCSGARVPLDAGKQAAMVGEDRSRDDDVELVRQRAATAQTRAAASAAAAARTDLWVQQGGPEVLRRVAERHRAAAACHLAAAEMHETYARCLDAWRPAKRDARPLFMSSVVAACGADGGAVVLLDEHVRQLAVASSDQRAARAQDLEWVLGEGPIREAVRTGAVVAAEGAGLVARWPAYGRGLHDLGLRAAAAVPLLSGERQFGALAVFDRLSPPRPADLQRVGAALGDDVLLGPDGDPLLYGEADLQSVVHQAAGMSSEAEGCSLADALTLIKARSFTEGTTTRDIAHRIVHQGLRLTIEPE
ncbi:GAF domain-containing protein [Streptomyces sp. NPDC050400]|uniref:GAF domain-containing protein n=1 Tax=Streptomyces sp. NPDC050400 TaxID=3365610 RepID=UPI0037960B94